MNMLHRTIIIHMPVSLLVGAPMPELPEVEVTRRSFAEAIAGARILAVRLGSRFVGPLGCPAESLVGLNVVGFAAAVSIC